MAGSQISLKILAISDRIFGGGAEVVFRKTSQLLASAGEIRIKSSSPYEGFANFIASGFGVLNVIYTIQLFYLVASWQPQVIHIHNFVSRIGPLPLMGLFLLKKVFGIAVVHTAHDFHMVCPNTGCIRWKSRYEAEQCIRCVHDGRWKNVVTFNCDRKGRARSVGRYLRHKILYDVLRIERLFDTVICPSRGLQSAISVRYGHLQTRVLRNPSFQSPDSLTPSRIEEGHKTTLGYFGRLQPEKGILRYLESTYDPKQFPRFLIYGEGEDWAKIKSVIRKRRLESHVLLNAAVPHIEIAPLMARIDAVVVPSLCVENCPLVVCDALRLGKRVVSVSQPGINELIEETHAGRKQFLDPDQYIQDLLSIYRQAARSDKDSSVHLHRNSRP